MKKAENKKNLEEFVPEVNLNEDEMLSVKGGDSTDRDDWIIEE